jgi:ABC-type nitrate/sulfonate/bicarbonate transport system substrate-binding protein
MRFSCWFGMGFRGRSLYSGSVSTFGRRAFLAGSAGLLAGCDAIRFGETGGRIRLAVSPGNQTLWRFLEAHRDDIFRPKGHLVDFFDVPTEEDLRSGFDGSKYDAIATLVPAVAQLAEAGQPVRFFLPLAWLREGYPLVVPEKSPIKAVGDVVGKRVSTFPLEHPGFAYWRAFLLKHYGLRGEQISTVQALSPEADLVDGKADAAFVSGNGWAALQAGGFRKVADLQGEFKWLTGADRLPVFAGFIARSSWIDGHAKFVADLTAAARQGLEQYKNDKNGFLDVVTNDPNGISASREENEAVATYLGYDAVGPERVALTQADADDFGRFFPLMADAGVLNTPPRDAGALFSLAKR